MTNILTDASARTYAKLGGFSGSGLEIIIAIAYAESGLDADATNTAGNDPPSTDRGILQINSYWHSEVPDVCAFNPLCAFQEGYRISSKGTDFTPWSTYTNGAYRKYLKAGQMEIGAIQPYAKAMSEFQGFTGDCVMNAALMGLAGEWPDRWKLTGTELDTIVRLAIQSYGAGPQGQWSWVGMTQWLQVLGYTVRNSNPSSYDWKSDLQKYAGAYPCVIGVTNAQALPNNELNVHNHGIALFGINTDGTLICGNGDALRGNPNMLQYYTLDDLVAAQISSVSWIEGPMLSTQDSLFASHFTVLPDGKWQSIKTKQVIGGDILRHYQYVPSIAGIGGLGVYGLPLTNEYRATVAPVPSGEPQPVYQDFERGRVLYDPNRVIDNPPGVGWTGSFPAHVVASGPSELPIESPVVDPRVANARGQLAAAESISTSIAGDASQLAAAIAAVSKALS